MKTPQVVELAEMSEVSKWTMRVLRLVSKKGQIFSVRVEGTDRAKLWSVTKIQIWHNEYGWLPSEAKHQKTVLELMKQAHPKRTIQISGWTEEQV